MSALLLSIAMMCQSSNLKKQLDCQTEIVKCASERDKMYDQYDADRYAAKVLECMEYRIK